MLAFLLFLFLDSFPIYQHLIAVVNMGIAENMRMTADKLIRNLVDNVLQIKVACLLCHTGMENNLHEHVAKLLTHAINIVSVHSLQIFVNLFNHVAANGFMCLLSVPGAAARLTQSTHNISQWLDVEIIKACFRQKVLRIAFFFAFLGKIVLILAKGNNTGNSFRIVNLFKYGILCSLSHRRNISACKMVDIRLSVQLEQLNRTAFLIRQAQITQEINFILVRQYIHQRNFQITGNHLAVNLSNHQRMLSGTCNLRKILRVNNLQAGNRVDAQLNVSQVQEAHRRLNNQLNALRLRSGTHQNNGFFRNQRASRYSINNITVLRCCQHTLNNTVINLFKGSSLFV